MYIHLQMLYTCIYIFIDMCIYMFIYKYVCVYIIHTYMYVYMYNSRLPTFHAVCSNTLQNRHQFQRSEIYSRHKYLKPRQQRSGAVVELLDEPRDMNSSAFGDKPNCMEHLTIVGMSFSFFFSWTWPFRSYFSNASYHYRKQCCGSAGSGSR